MTELCYKRFVRFFFEHPLYWFIMVYLGLSWAILVYHRLSQAISGYLEISLAISGYLLLSWPVSAYLSLLLLNMLSWAISGYLWLSLAILGYLWPSWAVYVKYQVSGCQRMQERESYWNSNFSVIFFCITDRSYRGACAPKNLRT